MIVVNPVGVDSLPEGFWCAGKQTGSNKLSPLQKYGGNLSSLTSPL